VYPALTTAWLSLFGPDSTAYVGLANYRFVFTDATMLLALRNNAIWVVFFTLLTVTLGLIIAVFSDRVAYESAAKALVFLPMAISFVAAGVIWKFMYDYRPPGAAQTGTLNALLTAAVPGFEPQAWLINAPGNTLALIAAAVWVWTGFCLVVLSAGLKGIPTEILEAARVDGAGEWNVFWRVTVPMLGSTIAVLTTTMIITALKAFDIVYVMTNGNFDTEVIANRMYKEMFNVRDFGRASAIASVLLLAIVPIMVINLRRFREQEARR
jgi:alpha-glucoside transport system permease protein